MCPACLAAIAWMVAGVVSTGGVTALAVTALPARGGAKEASEDGAVQNAEEFPSPKEKENEQ
jgi:hypothetical protein